MKKKVCLALPTLQPGGMERVMSELACYFSELDDLDVHLILYGREAVIFYDLSDKVIVHIPKSIFNTSFRFFATVGRLYYIRNTVKRIKPDAVLSFGEYWNSFVLLALLGLSYPVFVSDRSSPAKRFSFSHLWMRKLLYPFAQGVIAQTETAKQLYEKQFRNRNVAVIGNPVPQSFTALEKREPVVLSVGRLISTKNHDKLIELFCKIDKPGWKLVIIGGDAQKQDNMERLKKLVATLGAEKSVILAGTQSNMEAYYQTSSIFAFSSTSEGFPNAIGEAMVGGLPTVAFDCIAGPSEMIDNDVNGYLIPVNDYDTFQERLELLMSDASLRERLGSEARTSIRTFSLENIGKKYYDFILGA